MTNFLTLQAVQSGVPPMPLKRVAARAGEFAMRAARGSRCAPVRSGTPAWSAPASGGFAASLCARSEVARSEADPGGCALSVCVPGAASSKSVRSSPCCSSADRSGADRATAQPLLPLAALVASAVPARHARKLSQALSHTPSSGNPSASVTPFTLDEILCRAFLQLSNQSLQ